MYRLNLSPQLADAINLSGDEMNVLKSVRDRAESYLQRNPEANCDPALARHIADIAAQQERARQDTERLRASFK